MNSRYSMAYFIVGVFFGGALMWIAQERNIDLTENQLDSLASNISQKISSEFLDKENSISTHQAIISNTDIELVDKIRDEVSLVVSDELQEIKDGMSEMASSNLSKKESISNEDYDKYNQAKLILIEAVNNQQMTFQQFSSDPSIMSLPNELRNKIMGELVMKLNNGEINPDVFIK